MIAGLLRYFLALLVLAWLPSPAKADVTGYYTFSSEEAEAAELALLVEVSDNGDFRMQMTGAPFYYASRSGEIFMVFDDAEDSRVMRAEDVRAIYVKEIGEDGMRVLDQGGYGDFQLKPSGERTVWQWQGTSFALAFADSENSEISFTSPPYLTLSNDPELAPLATPFLAMSQDHGFLLTTFGSFMPTFIEKIEQFGSPIQLGGLNLYQADTGPINPERFKLPSRPLPRGEVEWEDLYVTF